MSRGEIADGSDRFGLVGTTLGGKYRVERVVGEGGFAVVYRARHQVWDEPVAVKCFTALADAPAELRRELHDQFVREGKLLTSLSSHTAAIVQAKDIGDLTTATGHWIPYMVLEWLDGRPLDAWLAHEAGTSRRPARDPLTAFRLMDGPARALGHAHARGVAHRDIKPANFFVLGEALTPGVVIKILDFGIAKVMHAHASTAMHATGTQTTSFTPAYGAPEQFDRRHGATGPWTDVFQMSLVLVELMRGGLPALVGDDFVQLAFASQNPAQRPTPRTHGVATSDAVEAVFQRALAVAVGQRYRDMSGFWDAFAAAVEPASSPRASHSPPHPPPGAAPYEVVLEFSRARDAGRPNAFEFTPQTYLLHSADGGVETAEFPWSQEFLEDLRTTQRSGHVPEVDHRIGEVLRTFLAGAGWGYHERGILAAAREGRSIFLTIRSAAAELYALPWEFVTLKATGQLLGSIPELLLRYEWPDAPSFPDRVEPAQRRGRVLFAWSAAGGEIPADRLVATLRAAFAEHPGAFDPDRDIIPHATVGKLARALEDAAEAGAPVDALHILCHGTTIGATYGLALDDETDPGTAVPVDAGRLQQLLAPHAGMLRMVVLAACDSGNVGRPGNHLGSVAQMIHRAGLRAVIASRYPLSTDGAIGFAEAFYGALVGEAATLEQAFLAGRDLLLRDPGEIDWASVQLYARHTDGHASALLQLPRRFGSGTLPPLPRPSPLPLHRTTLPTPTPTPTPVQPFGVLFVVLGLGLVALVARKFVTEDVPSAATTDASRLDDDDAGADNLPEPTKTPPAKEQQPPVDNPPIDNPPIDKPPVDKPPIDIPPVVDKPLEPPLPTDAARERRKREILADLKKLAERESADSSERCAIVNDAMYITITLALAVDPRGRVRATVRAPGLNADQRECIRERIEADISTSPGDPFTIGSVTIKVD
jgi:serine/threonine protein kinase